MLVESIIIAILVLSLGGILIILIRKAPALSSLPQNGTIGFKKYQFVADFEDKLKKIFVSFEKQIFLHKFLSWVKVMTMKIELKIDHLLHGIRKKAQQIDKEIKEKK